MVGSDGIRWRWRYRETKTTTSSSTSYYYYSSSSGTISTGYTSSGSRLSSGPLVAAICYSDWELDVQNAKKKEEQTKYITGLVHEFFKGGGGGDDDDMGVLERWLIELGVDWVLHLAIDASAAAGKQLDHAFDAWSWIRALTEIVETIIAFTTSRFADRGSVSVGMRIIVSKEEEEQATLDQFQFPRFFKQTMLKMLAFVDFVVCEQVPVSNSSGFDASYEEEKLSFLLGVHGALSKALTQTQILLSSSYSIQGDMVGLLAAKEAMAGEAVWSKMEELKTRILESSDADVEALQGSSDVHRATRTLISYIRLLQTNYKTLTRLVSEAATLGKYVPQIGIGDIPPLDSMIIEMASCLEEKLANNSESFSDQSFKFMFMLNNSYFIWQQVQPIWSIIEFNANATHHKFLSFIETHMRTVTRRVLGYMESYLQASWAPVLLCLFSSTTTPLCLGKNCNSALNNFESEFQKTYTRQKLWKVPDPGLRKSLREAITKKIMSGYTKFLDDNDITTPRVAPQEVEERLQELFEG